MITMPSYADKTLLNIYQTLPLWKRASIALLGVLIPLIVVAAYGPDGIFFSNQYLYYLHGMYLGGVEYLQTDPGALSRPYHVMFTYVVYVLQQMNWLANGSQMLAALQSIILGIGLIAISVGIVVSWRERQAHPITARDFVNGFVIAAIFVLFSNGTSITNLDGMAGMSLMTPYFQASNMGVFVVLAIGMILLKKLRLAVILLIIASIFHSHYLIMSSPLMLLIAYMMLQQRRWREGFIWLVIFGTINLPFFIMGPIAWTNINSAETIQQFNLERSPHHYDVTLWWNVLEATRLVVMGLATILAIWKLSAALRNIMVFYFLYIVSGIAIVGFTGNETIASLVPWRASSFMLPLSQLIIIGVVLLFIFEFTQERVTQCVLSGVTLFVVVLTFSIRPWDWPPAYYPHTSPEIELVRAHTNSSDMILVPPRMDDGFRVYAERPTYVLWKTTDFDVAEWQRRLATAGMMMEGTIEQQQAICDTEPFTYYLLPVDAPAVPDITPIATTDDYILVRCPG